MMKRLSALLVALVMALCTVSVLAESAEADPVLVTVNGEEVRASNGLVQAWIAYLLQDADDDLSEEELQEINQYALNYATDFIISRQKLNELGQGYTQEDLEAATKQAWTDIVDNIAVNQFGVGEDATDDEKAAGRADAENYILTNYNYTEESYAAEYQSMIEMDLIYTKTEEYASADLGEVTDEEVEAYFNELVEQDRQMLLGYASSFGISEGVASAEELNETLASLYEIFADSYGYVSMYMPEGYRGITHILLPVEEELLTAWKDLQARLEEQEDSDTEATAEGEPAAETTEEPETEAEAEPVTQEMVDAAKQAILDSVKEKVDEIQAKLAEGASFEDLIPEYGTDEGMADEARRATGYAVHKGSIAYDKNFADAAMALENIGDVSEPVVSQFGVHLLHYLRDVPGGAVEFTDEIREALKEELAEQKATSAYNELVSSWIAESEYAWTEAGESWKLPEQTAETENTEE